MASPLLKQNKQERGLQSQTENIFFLNMANIRSGMSRRQVSEGNSSASSVFFNNRPSSVSPCIDSRRLKNKVSGSSLRIASVTTIAGCIVRILTGARRKCAIERLARTAYFQRPEKVNCLAQGNYCLMDFSTGWDERPLHWFKHPSRKRHNHLTSAVFLLAVRLSNLSNRHEPIRIFCM